MSVWRGRGGTGRFPHTRTKKGARGGNMGFPHGSEPKASDAHGPRIRVAARVPNALRGRSAPPALTPPSPLGENRAVASSVGFVVDERSVPARRGEGGSVRVTIDASAG